ncbi:hypothetical protein QUB80_02395 [Chlorogloeopsis sp. ULAP01]|uniref:hypothetical protein n=1 Tax=Chlorogloeopsis sp. ULAP01 TaxID=3056483 RepID=UPI0025AAD7C5|nr:hypothetical protein [Chlorogloeopsis sp. ULAP01]MDM9379551.1 hypothetical protein [Chlorogloeopsis sp. ULAP01]
MKKLQSDRSLYNRKIISLLLVLKILLIGIKAENRIQQGDTPIEVLIWMINQCIPVLQKAGNLEDKKK